MEWDVVLGVENGVGGGFCIGEYVVVFDSGMGGIEGVDGFDGGVVGGKFFVVGLGWIVEGFVVVGE